MPSTVKCHQETQYIRFYTKTPSPWDIPWVFLEVCEVEVYGCEVNHFGENCTSCGDPCEKCDIVKGCQQCQTGFTGKTCEECRLGFSGHNCEPCKPGRYGSNCTQECSGNCYNNESCNNVNGSCLNGCKKGYIGDKCSQACGYGTYGFQCQDQCSGNCFDNETCDNVEGNCTNGCSKGWEGSQCFQECVKGTFGENCKQNCSRHCFSNMTCDRFNGACPHGCDAGWQGSDCKKKCPSGDYGLQCNETCETCQGMSCSHINGSCNQGCVDGWTGSMCKNACLNGTFGENCKHNCSRHCFSNMTCDRFNGTCPLGCDAGWQGSDCKKKCLVGKYGLHCNETCETCQDRSCNNINGSCNQGCVDGWTGFMCKNVCPQGFFGYRCSSKCGNCKNESCHHVNGSCQGDCKAEYKGDRCQDIVSAEQSESQSNSHVLAGTGIGILVAIVLFICFIVVRIRRKKLSSIPSIIHSEEREGQMNICSSIDSLATEDQQTANTEETTYLNVENTFNNAIDIIITDLATLISLKTANDFSEFKKEYQSIPYGEEPHIPCTVGKLLENTKKNRYKTTFPYDHSRVVLRDGMNDYINANYIQNMKKERVYIASQGPKLNTLIDHWNMIWQENVSVIVMLTNLVEGIKKKCDKYWPDLEMEMVFGEIKIKLLQEKQYANYVTRILEVISTKSRSSRVVTQFHYTQWPDHGVPDPVSLAVFQKHVRRIQENYEDSPLLVHCSAGIGRTGTFIALDALYQHGLETGAVNIQKYVKMMRKDRMSMVQNCEQYIELYNALFESFNGKSDTISKDNLISDSGGLYGSANVTPQWLQSQYKELQTIKRTYSSDDKKEGNVHKELNMTRNILPVDKYRAILMSNVLGRSNYYNAVFLSTFTDRNMLIAGQYPLSGNSVDLIRLLLDHESSIVVFVNRLSDVPSSSEWFSEKTTTLHPYEIIRKDTSNVTQTIRIHDLKIRHLEEDTCHAIHLFEIMSWRIIDALPSDVKTLSDVIRHIQMDVASQSTKTPITILSKDGATGCGVLCGVYNAVQQLQQDDVVDMFSIVRQLQIRRPEMISTLEEYQFCFRAASNILSENSTDAYSHAESVYANT
ncbi:receptor-type tyrosine-protein phosphatase epsilon-like isoform X3 [Saccostrea echinata]|uniref:receptor-type tyrosine-protein phosphatase epsilon-like isoform X3 n=1 Tax=Saccostrea echinata TaxID=191078 RepID=UPI002A817254|nr:receptor-type tyrosine-protein phosphatase epsilon-like isoform X3 [Saccostrea echinata]